MSALQKLHEHAARTRTPREFTKLLEELRDVIPYRCLFGYCLQPATYQICRFINIDFPRPFITWYLTRAMIKHDVVFDEAVRTGQPQSWCDLYRHTPDKFDPEYVRKVEEYQLQHKIKGMILNREKGGYFAIVLNSESAVQSHLKTFAELLPVLSEALQNSYHSPMLSPRKEAILLLRVQGQQPKQIAHDLGISPRTVKMHLVEIKHTLYADDLVQAAWIAAQLGFMHGGSPTMAQSDHCLVPS